MKNKRYSSIVSEKWFDGVFSRKRHGEHQIQEVEDKILVLGQICLEQRHNIAQFVEYNVKHCRPKGIVRGQPFSL